MHDLIFYCFSSKIYISKSETTSLKKCIQKFLENIFNASKFWAVNTVIQYTVNPKYYCSPPPSHIVISLPTIALKVGSEK